MPSRRQLANAVRALSMDAVQRANSGHPGAPMGMADVAEVLWNDYLRHNPSNPGWADRDRFVLSNGHAAMLLYSLLHLSGYELPIKQIRNFRQLHAQTPGHPEYGCAPGVETTTGPLGQGLSNAVGMALAEKVLAARFNRPGFEIVNHHTYVFAGDGCLMEGVSHEACSLAGTLGLSKLIMVYDDNGVSIDGDVKGWFTDDTPARFRAYGWHVIEDVEGHDADAVARAFDEARAETARPTLLCCRTTIGFGAPNKQGGAECHGAPLGDDEIALARKTLDWEHPPFEVPEEIYAGWDARDKGRAFEDEWNARFAEYRKAHPDLAAEFDRRMRGELAPDWSSRSASLVAAAHEAGRDAATRKSSGDALTACSEILPELIGGSADLAGSNVTLGPQSKPVTKDNADGNYVYFGVREFAMTAIASGLCLHGGFIAYGATFLTFSDYARNAVRLAALMKQGVILIYTHDSIGLGEDGPTHQPIEHLSSLRLMPNLDVWRPCDAVETTVAWKCAIERRDGPTAMALSRQTLPHAARDAEQLAHVTHGGYMLHDAGAPEPELPPELVIIATGSEVAPALAACRRLGERGRRVRLVSMPCAEVFERQSEAYRDSVLPPGVRRLVVEAAAPGWWYKYAGGDGKVIGIESYGESAPGGVLFEHFGFTAERIAEAADAMLAAPS